MKPTPRPPAACGSSRRRLFSVTLALLLGGAASGFGQTLTQRLNDIVNRLGNLQNTVNTTLTQARNAATRTTGLPDVVTRIQEVYNTVDGPGKQFIDGYVTMVLTLIEQQREGFAAFTTPDAGSGLTPAAVFRTDLTGLLNDMEQLTNALIAIDGKLQFELDVTVVKRLVDALPDLLLYPFHVMMTRDSSLMNSGIRDLFAELNGQMPAVRELLGLSSPAAMEASFVAGRSAAAASARPAAAGDGRIVGEVFKVGGRTIVVVAKVLGAIAEGEEKEGKVGIHGYIAIHAKADPVKVIAGLLEVLGEMTTNVGERILDKVDGNEAAAEHQELVDALTTIQTDQDTLLAGQQQILDALSRLDPNLFPVIPDTPPTAAFAMTSGPRRVHIDAGEPISLSAGAVASPNATFQWRKDGNPIAGAVDATFSILQAAQADTGIYDVVVTDESGSQISAPALVELIPSRILNVSVRFDVPDGRITIAGFVLDSPKRVIVRGVGRSLADLGIPLERTMADPEIAIYNQAGQVIAANDNHDGTPETAAVMSAVGAFPLSSSTDAVIVTELPAGAYTVHVRSHDQTGGECIVEVYDTE